MIRVQHVFLRFFAFVLMAGTILLLIYNYQVSHDLAESLVKSEIDEGLRQVDVFKSDLRSALERGNFLDLYDANRDDFLDFEKLSQKLLKQNRYITYVHWKNADGETLLYKGPEYLHRITISGKGVAYQTATTSEVREIIVDRGTEKESLADVTTPLSGHGKPLGELSVGFSKERITREGQETLRRIRHRTALYGGVSVALLALGFLLVFRQVRRIERLERTLEEKQKLAELGTLASGLVHEIRNPINGVNLNLELLEEEMGSALPPEAVGRLKQLMGRIKPSMGHLEQLSNEFLQYARPPRPRPVEDSLSEVVRLVADFVRPQCLAQNIPINLDLDPALTAMPLDREIVKQVILNLVMNALQHMPGGGVLTLRTSRLGRRARVSVKDTGPGIPPEVLARIFDLFFSTRERGVGLGLPIARRMVHDHGGEISVETAVGTGTTFHVDLPVHPEKSMIVEEDRHDS